LQSERIFHFWPSVEVDVMDDIRWDSSAKLDRAVVGFFRLHVYRDRPDDEDWAWNAMRVSGPIGTILDCGIEDTNPAARAAAVNCLSRHRAESPS
jgi:hypothetical protein